MSFQRALKALQFAQQNGWSNLLALINRKMASKTGLFGKADILAPYDFIRQTQIGQAADAYDVPANTINWFIPKVGKGSGGHLNIFRFIKNLEELGFECRIIIVGDLLPVSPAVARNSIHEWFFPLKAEVFVGTDLPIPPAYFSIATSWQTAYIVKAFESTRERCYFVQDFEPWFYAAGSDSLLAENTYHFGFHGITAGNWLSSKLSAEYGMRTFPLGFSYDRDLYKLQPRTIGSSKRLFFYARPPTARRAFELGLLVLREICQQRPDVVVVMAGWDVSNYDIPFPCEQAGLKELDELADLYRQCDAALVLSCSNLSLLPLELMACGVPVISNRAPYTQWMLNDDNSVLANPDVDSLCQAVVQVLESPELAESLRTAAVAFAESTSWEREASRLADHLHELSKAPPAKADQPKWNASRA